MTRNQHKKVDGLPLLRLIIHDVCSSMWRALSIAYLVCMLLHNEQSLKNHSSIVLFVDAKSMSLQGKDGWDVKMAIRSRL